MSQCWLFTDAEIKPQEQNVVVTEPLVLPEKKTKRKGKKEPELFSRQDMVQPRLTPEETENLAWRVIRSANIGIRYMYRVKEVCSMLRITYDEMQTLLNFYKLDCVVIRGTIIRIPWWSLAEYLIDPADDVETAMYAYLKSLPHGSLAEKKTA